MSQKVNWPKSYADGDRQLDPWIQFYDLSSP